MDPHLEQLNCNAAELSLQALDSKQSHDYLLQLSSHWQLMENDSRLAGHFVFPDYATALEFANNVAHIAQQQDHHPSLLLEYRSCDVCFYTHTLNTLSIKDFICAAKIDRLFN